MACIHKMIFIYYAKRIMYNSNTGNVFEFVAVYTLITVQRRKNHAVP